MVHHYRGPVTSLESRTSTSGVSSISIVPEDSSRLIDLVACGLDGEPGSSSNGLRMLMACLIRETHSSASAWTLEERRKSRVVYRCEIRKAKLSISVSV